MVISLKKKFVKKNLKVYFEGLHLQLHLQSFIALLKSSPFLEIFVFLPGQMDLNASRGKNAYIGTAVGFGTEPFTVHHYFIFKLFF